MADENKKYIEIEGDSKPDYTIESVDNSQHIVHQDVDPTGEVVYEIESSESELTRVNVENQNIVHNEDQLLLSNRDENGNVQKIKINDLSQKYDGSAAAWKKEIKDGFLHSAGAIAEIPASLVKSTVEGIAMAAGEELSTRLTDAIFKKLTETTIRFSVFWGCDIENNFVQMEFTNIHEISIRKIREATVSEKKQVSVSITRGLDGKRIGFSAMTRLLDNNNIFAQNGDAAFSAPNLSTPGSLSLSSLANFTAKVSPGEIMLVITGFPEGGLLPPLPGPLGKAELYYRFDKVQYANYRIEMRKNPIGDDNLDVSLRGLVAAETITFVADLADESSDGPLV